MPSRIIKESICSSDTLDELSWFAECFFYRLIVNCDDYGRMDARPKILKSKLFPLKTISDKDIARTLEALRAAGIVDLYEVDDRPYLQLRTWSRHQQIRAKKSKFPAPESIEKESESICNQLISDDGKCPRNPIQSESESESNPNRHPNAPAREDDDDVVVKAAVQASHDQDAVIACWNRTGGKIAGKDYDTIDGLLMQHSAADICEAINLAHENGAAGKWAYVRKVLENWKQHGKGARTGKPQAKGTGDLMQRYTLEERQKSYSSAIVDFDAEVNT